MLPYGILHKLCCLFLHTLLSVSPVLLLLLQLFLVFVCPFLLFFLLALFLLRASLFFSSSSLSFLHLLFLFFPHSFPSISFFLLSALLFFPLFFFLNDTTFDKLGCWWPHLLLLFKDCLNFWYLSHICSCCFIAFKTLWFEQ